MIDLLTFCCVVLLVLEQPLAQKRLENAAKTLKRWIFNVQRQTGWW